MKKVVCWCCEYFDVLDWEENKQIEFNGKCRKKMAECYGHGDICSDFIMKKGLHTNRIISKINKK